MYSVPSLEFFLMDSRNGGVVEAWVTLNREDMALFKHNKEVLASTSQSPYVLLSISPSGGECILVRIKVGTHTLYYNIFFFLYFSTSERLSMPCQNRNKENKNNEKQCSFLQSGM